MAKATKANPALSKKKSANARKQLRKERYRHMIDLGFSTTDARRFRDRSGVNIETHVESERERIVDIRTEKRSQSDKDKLRDIRAHNRQKPAVESAGRNKTRADRWQEFSNWTKNRNFPGWAMDYIGEMNRDKELDPLDSWGFRRFYYRYVQNRAETSAAKLADRDDS